MSNNVMADRIAELEALQQMARLKDGLPHLYGLKMYPWQEEFFNTWDKTMLLTAANQIGKSSIQIRKYIDFCTRPDLWRKLFPAKFAVDPNAKPFMWYLYPNQDTVMQEFDEKWEKEFMPRGEFKNHPIYGWRKVIKNKVLKAIQFNSGAAIYFKTYSQDVMDLQAGTCWVIGCDEELPENLYSELTARLFASDGFFSMVFTATLGQDFWRRAMEPTKTEREELKGAWKRQVSVYDCKFYTDGTASHWTDERIERNINKCKSRAEVLRRIFGKFVKDDNVMYHCFSRDRHYVPYPTMNGREFKGVPKGWEVYSGVDIGGGGDSHPASFTFISVNKERTKVRVFKGKRLDGIGNTTALDVLMHYQGVRDGMKIKPVSQAYDWQSKDFKTLADRAGESFLPANKDRESGVDIINSLFKYNILKIYSCDEHDKLVEELEGLSGKTAKANAKDDFIDSMRYAIMSAPIDWAKIIEQIEAGKLHVTDGDETRKVIGEREERADWWKEHKETTESWDREAEAELSFWGNLY